MRPLGPPIESPLKVPPRPVPAAPPEPPELFANGEGGAMFDTNDIASMFQDLAGTVPAVVNQPVGKILDQSPNGNHATASELSKRPTLRQDGAGFLYLEFVNSLMLTPAIDMHGSANAVLWVGGGKSADPQGIVCEYAQAGQPWVSQGAFRLLCNYPNTARADWLLHGAGNYDDMDYAEAPTPSVVSIAMDLAAATPAARSTIRLDGAPIVPNVTNAGDAGGAFGNWPMTLGARVGGSSALTGRLYEFILRAAATPLATVQAWEAWISGQME